jgi:hypothetical protein
VPASDRELIWNAIACGRVVTILCEAVLDGMRLIGAVVHFGTDSASYWE